MIIIKYFNGYAFIIFLCKKRSNSLYRSPQIRCLRIFFTRRLNSLVTNPIIYLLPALSQIRSCCVQWYLRDRTGPNSGLMRISIELHASLWTIWRDFSKEFSSKTVRKRWIIFSCRPPLRRKGIWRKFKDSVLTCLPSPKWRPNRKWNMLLFKKIKK